jgi:RNA polymerase sigma-70 factor (ECF subfamily)
VTEISDRRLVDRVLSRGDESAFRELYRRHSPALYRLAVRLLGGSDPDAGDVVQETWCRVLEAFPRYNGTSSLRTWLAGVVVNCCREHVRSRVQSRNIPPLRLVPTTPPMGREVQLDIRRALAGLPQGFREVLVLHDLDGYTHEEISTILGIAPGTSKSQLSRARRALRGELAGHVTKLQELP